MTNVISESHTIQQVITAINAAHSGESNQYFGGSDNRSAEELAGQYAWEAAKESGYEGDDTIEAHLEYLREQGAKFVFSDALKNAIILKKQ